MLGCCSCDVCAELDKTRGREVGVLEEDEGCGRGAFEETDVLVVEVGLALRVDSWCTLHSRIDHWGLEGDGICAGMDEHRPSGG